MGAAASTAHQSLSEEEMTRLAELKALSPEAQHELRATKRLQPVTVQTLLDTGARHYAWIFPGEKLAGMARPVAAGAFAYTFETGGKYLETALAGGIDDAFDGYFPQRYEGCYFPIAT